MKFLPVVAE